MLVLHFDYVPNSSTTQSSNIFSVFQLFKWSVTWEVPINSLEAKRVKMKKGEGRGGRAGSQELAGLQVATGGRGVSLMHWGIKKCSLGGALAVRRRYGAGRAGPGAGLKGKGAPAPAEVDPVVMTSEFTGRPRGTARRCGSRPELDPPP